MSALDGVLADLAESDPDCAYVTLQRQQLEMLIQDWLDRGDRIALLGGLITAPDRELPRTCGSAQPDTRSPARESLIERLRLATADAASLIAHHRHAIRLEMAAQLKRVLRAAVGEIHTHISEAMVQGQDELAERLESDRQTLQIVISAIDTMVNRLLTRDLAAATAHQGKHTASPPRPSERAEEK